MPIMEFDQFDGPFRDPLHRRKRLTNAWGYNTDRLLRSRSRMYSYYGKVGEQVDEFKMMVRELHKNMGSRSSSTSSSTTPARGQPLRPERSAFKGLDNNIYYMLARRPAGVLHGLHRLRQYPELQPPGRPDGSSSTASATGLTEMHVDGFRFDLAAVFAIDVDQSGEGEDADHPRDRDPTPSWLADQADRRALVASRQYQASARSPTAAGPSGTASIRDNRPEVGQGGRRGSPPSSAPRVTGSLRPLRPRERGRPADAVSVSINFVTCHDGFTLNDLVSLQRQAQ